jgi:Glycine-zipper domain
MKFLRTVSLITASLVLGACAVIPTGPSVLALPGTSKTFDQFRFDESSCRQYAYDQNGGETADRAASDSVARSAVVGTVIGAVAGAALGGSRGAGVGAGTGLLFGSVAGTGTAQASAYGTQRRYDNAYLQCMYAKGHRVPMSGQMMSDPRQVPYTSAQGSAVQQMPPPPPGSPPPPPPGVQQN